MTEDKPMKDAPPVAVAVMNIDAKLEEIARRYATPEGRITCSNFEKAVREWVAQTGEKKIA